MLTPSLKKMLSLNNIDGLIFVQGQELLELYLMKNKLQH